MKPYGLEINLGGLRGTHWQDYAIRYLLGGAITVAAGLIAKYFGPVVGGLFLAFPAILPASATLIEKHEIKKKAKAGFDGRRRGVKAAGLDGAGACLGALGLIVFAAVIWRLVDRYNPWLVLIGATFAWLVVAVTAWLVKKRL